MTPAQPFQAFLDEHRSSVFGFLRTMVGPDDAEDCFQETFMAALRNYEGIDGRNPRAWLLTIARNKAIDQLRSRKRRPTPQESLPELVATPGRADPAAIVVTETDPELWSRVAELPEKQRAAIALRFVADLRFREVGEAMETSEDAARQNVHEGLKRLRTQIAREEQR